MEPKYTEIIKLLIRHTPYKSYPIAIDDKGDEYRLTVNLDDEEDGVATQRYYIDATKLM